VPITRPGKSPAATPPSSDADHERGRRIAAFLLDAATEFGIRIGTDGVDEVVMVVPMRTPPEICRWLESEVANHKAAVIAFIVEENAMRAGAPS
jgi:hypothetical protein